MSDHISYSKSGAVGFIGPKAVNVYRMMTLASGLKMEVKGMRMSRGRTCYAVIKSEFGLRGNKARVLAQFLPLVEEAKAAIPVEVQA